MARLLLCLFLAVVLGFISFRPAIAFGYPAYTSQEFRQGVIAFAAWDLDDTFNSYVTIAGNDVMNVNIYGMHVLRYTGVLLNVYQRFCDTATDELVLRDFSVLPAVGANNVVIDYALNHAVVNVSLNLTGVETRTPNCATPDYSNRQFSFPTIPLTLLFRWYADGQAHPPFEQSLAQDVWPGSGVVVFKTVGIQKSATVTGSISSTHPDFNYQLDNNGTYYRFLARDSWVFIQTYIP